MNRTAPALLAAALLLFACGDSGQPGSTPRATFEAIRAAVAARDWGAVYDLLGGREIERVRRQLDADRVMLDEPKKELLKELDLSARELDAMSERDYFIRYTEVRSRARPEILDRLAKAEIYEEKVDGETAVIVYLAGDEKKEMELARREGLWYVVRW